ncbi:putative ribonuclease H-like superfamily [Plasmopara halstedii]
MDATQPLIDVSRRPRGRPPSRSWAYFTSLVEPQKLFSAECRHCNQLVQYHKKWAQARAHLMKCAPFLRLIETLSPSDVPPWYLAELNRRQSNYVPSRVTSGYTLNQMVPSTVASGTSFKMIHPVAMPLSDTQKCGTKYDWVKVNENIAMHLFTTIEVDKLLNGTLELSYLSQAFQVNGTEVALCTKETLMTELLDQCYERVKNQVLHFLQSGLVPATLSLEFHEEKERLICMATLASSPMYPLYVDFAHVPNAGTNMALFVHHVVQLIESISCPIAGCIMPLTMERKTLLKQFQLQFPTMYFHGCMRYAFYSLLQTFFIGSRTTSVPFLEELQQFALQCYDLLDFVPHEKLKVISNELEIYPCEVVHITIRRRISLTQAYLSLLQAEIFQTLSIENFTCSPSKQKQVFQLVHHPSFVEKLDKYLAIFQPFHALLTTFTPGTKSSIAISEVFLSFQTLISTIEANQVLTSLEKISIVTLIREQETLVLGSAHRIAYLLDPRYLGQNFSTEEKVQVEHELLTFGTKDQEDETLCAEYTAFCQSMKNPKRKEITPLDFWILEGSKWPTLQALACRIFVMPVSCAREGALLHALDAPKDRETREKVTFVRMNTLHLQRAKADGNVLASFTTRPSTEAKDQEITASMVV